LARGLLVDPHASRNMLPLVGPAPSVGAWASWLSLKRHIKIKKMH
jgi:hypothetical protein